MDDRLNFTPPHAEAPAADPGTTEIPAPETPEPERAEPEREFVFQAHYSAHDFGIQAETQHRFFLHASAHRAVTLGHGEHRTPSFVLAIATSQAVTTRSARWLHLSVTRQRLHQTLSATQRPVAVDFPVRTLANPASQLRRHLARYGLLTELEVLELTRTWRLNTDPLSVLRARPQTFVWDGTHWRLTPWTERGTFTPGAGTYVQEAARYWVSEGRVPTPTEEWSTDVRLLTERTLHYQELPPYFVPEAGGPFWQPTPYGGRSLRLTPEHLPEGAYFSWSEPGRETVTYSVSGGAFLEDKASGPSVVTSWATRRFSEALLNVGHSLLTWHAAGEAFRELCTQRGIVPREAAPKGAMWN